MNAQSQCEFHVESSDIFLAYPSPSSNLIQFISLVLRLVNSRHDFPSISFIASNIKAEFLPEIEGREINYQTVLPFDTRSLYFSGLEQINMNHI